MATTHRATTHRAAAARRPWGVAPTGLLLLGAIYCLFPVLWVLIAATKSPGELFTTSTLAFGTASPTT